MCVGGSLGEVLLVVRARGVARGGRKGVETVGVIVIFEINKWNKSEDMIHSQRL